MNVFPVRMVELRGSTALGASGVLLIFAGPVNTCTVPRLATVENGRTNVTGASLTSVLEIYRRNQQSIKGWEPISDLDDELP